jgi:hypothetical protein
MAEIVNLRLARKVKQRGEAERQAAANRARHGQTKAERLRQEQETARQAKQLDGHRREDE